MPDGFFSFVLRNMFSGIFVQSFDVHSIKRVEYSQPRNRRSNRASCGMAHHSHGFKVQRSKRMELELCT